MNNQHWDTAEKRKMDKVFEKAWQVFEALRRNPQLANRRTRAAPAVVSTTVDEDPIEMKPRKRPGVSQFAQGLLTSGLPDYLRQPPSPSASYSPTTTNSSSPNNKSDADRKQSSEKTSSSTTKRRFSETSDRNGNFFLV